MEAPGNLGWDMLLAAGRLRTPQPKRGGLRVTRPVERSTTTANRLGDPIVNPSHAPRVIPLVTLSVTLLGIPRLLSFHP